MWDSAVAWPASSPLTAERDLGSEQATYYMEECISLHWLGGQPTGCYTTGTERKREITRENVPEESMSACVLYEYMTADNMKGKHSIPWLKKRIR